MEKKTIGAFIAALRKANGLTQKQLADKLCVSDKAVSRWERDETLPDLMLIPVIAGISYEIIRLAGNSNNILVRLLSAPGMLLQRLTTKEPDKAMVEVAIASVEAIFDWKEWQKENWGKILTKVTFDKDFSQKRVDKWIFLC